MKHWNKRWSALALWLGCASCGSLVPLGEAPGGLAGAQGNGTAAGPTAWPSAPPPLRAERTSHSVPRVAALEREAFRPPAARRPRYSPALANWRGVPQDGHAAGPVLLAALAELLRSSGR